MTAITPLESFHKKGLFGNHHKKTENDLLKISEVKNLTIIQIAQYKKSKIDLNEFNMDGLKLPKEPLTVNSKNKTRILWLSPKIWLIVSEEDISKKIEEKCNPENFAVTDISHSRAVIQIEGNRAKEIMKKGCPINFNNLKKNNCVSSVFQGINIIIDTFEDDLEKVRVFTLRSFGQSFYHDITDAALEEGYVGK